MRPPSDPTTALLHLLLGGRSAEQVLDDTRAAIARDAQDPRPLITEVLHTPQGMTFGRVHPVRARAVPTAPVVVPDLNAHLQAFTAGRSAPR